MLGEYMLIDPDGEEITKKYCDSCSGCGHGGGGRALRHRVSVGVQLLLAFVFCCTVGLFIAGDITPSVVVRYDARYAVPINKGLDHLMKDVTKKILEDDKIIQEAMNVPIVQETILSDPTVVTDITTYVTCPDDECKKAAEKALGHDVATYFDDNPDKLCLLLADEWVSATFFPDAPYSDSDEIVLSSITAFQEAEAGGAYGIAAAIFIMSITWPYVKILLQIGSWVLPLPEEMREYVLIFLEQSGKLCIIEVLMLTLAMEGFVAEVNYNYPGTDVLMLRIKTTVFSKYGMIVYVVATTLTLIMGNITTIVHNLPKLTDGGYGTVGDGRNRLWGWAAVFNAVFALAIGIAMQVVPSFQFEYTGTMASSMVQSLRTLSLSGAAIFLAGEGEKSDLEYPPGWEIEEDATQSVGIWIFVYALFLCAAPLLAAVVGLAATVLGEFKGGSRDVMDVRLSFAASSLAAWSCIEVFIFAALVMREDLVQLFEQELEKLVGQDTDDPVLIALTGGEPGDTLLALDFEMLPAGATLLGLFWGASLLIQGRTLYLLGVFDHCCGDGMRMRDQSLIGLETMTLSP